MSTIVLKKKNKKNVSKRKQVEMYAGDAYSLAKRTAQGLNYVRRLINIETKHLDTFGSGTADNTTGFVQCLSLIAQGLDLTNRVGDSIRIQHMAFKFQATVSAAAFASTVRVILFRDLENAGANPSMSDFMSGASAAESPMIPYNFINTRTRFSVLFDEVLAISYAGPSNSVCQYQSTHQGHIRFRGTAAAAASNAQGCIYMLVLSNETTNLPAFRYHFALEYTDD